MLTFAEPVGWKVDVRWKVRVKTQTILYTIDLAISGQKWLITCTSRLCFHLICLFVSRITQKLLDRSSQNLVEMRYMDREVAIRFHKLQTSNWTNWRNQPSRRFAISDCVVFLSPSVPQKIGILPSTYVQTVWPRASDKVFLITHIGV